MLINQWGGISDDSFLTRANECLDMDGIDIRTTPRKIQSAQSFLGTYASDTAPYNDTMNYVTETIDGVIQSYGSHCYSSFTNIDTLVAGADRHITVGSNLSDYNVTTNPEWIRHFFFTYDNATNPIKEIWYVAWARAVLHTINTSGWAAPADIASNRCTAVCYLWKWSIIFARGNKIYEINPSVATPLIATGAKIELEIGAVVKNLYYYNWQITIVYNIGNDCYIRNATYDGVTYKLTYYADISPGDKCLSSAINRWMLYWISTSGIFQYSGQSQLVKAYPFTSSAICAYNKWVLRIGDGTNFFEYGVNKPGYGTPITRMSTVLPIQWVTQIYVITFQSGANKFKLDSPGAYKASNFYITAPYTAGQFGIQKKGLGIRIGYRFNRLAAYTTTTIQETITIQIQTDLIERVNSTTYLTIATITDIETNSLDIWFQQINTALQTAGYSCDFWYIRFKIILGAGDPYTGYGSTLFRKTPEVFDFYISHEEIKVK